MIKRRSWKLGHLEVGVIRDVDPADDTAPEVFRHEPGAEAASASPALWNQPLSRRLLAVPILVAVVWLKLWGTSTWWWVLVAVAVPLLIVSILAAQRRSES
jgi:hypothetical protein